MKRRSLMEQVVKEVKQRPITTRILKIALLIIFTLAFTVIYFVISCKVDYLIGKVMGGVQEPGGGAWTVYGNISWTFTSLLGPALVLHRFLSLGLAILSGLLTGLLILGIFPRLRLFFRYYRWIVVAVGVTWLLRIPVPLKYSLFYFTCVRY